VIAGDGCPQGAHLELLPGGQRLVVPGAAVALRVVGSPRPQRGERARRQVAAGQFPEPGDLAGQPAGGVAQRLGGLPGHAAPGSAVTL
jgi:hypothetical protein